MSQLYKQSLTKFSFSTEVIAFSRNKLLGLCSGDNRMSLWGTNHILLYLKILRDIQEKKLSINQIITFANEGEQESKSLRSTNAQAGDKRLLIDVLNQAVSFNAPDCIKALWQVYDGKKNTQKILLELAEELNISKESQKSLTGRLVTGQKTNIFDYYKIGLEYLKLNRSIFSYIKNRIHIINDKTYEPQSLLDLKGDAIASIFWGTNQSDCLIFHDYQGELTCSIVINGKSYIHTVESAIALYLDDSDNEKIDEALSESPIVNILADTYFGEYYTEKRKVKNRDDALLRHGYHFSFEKLSKKMSQKDFNIITYEGVLIDPDEDCFNKHKIYYLGGNKDKTVAELKNRSVDLVNLGNNHAKDYGENALLGTLSAFQESGIATLGAGENIKEATKPFLLKYKEKSVAFFSGYWYRRNQDLNFDFYATNRPGVASLDGILLDRISLYKKQNPTTKIVVLAHWGVDFKDIQNKQRELAKDLFDRGADFIFGSGPHKVQPIERIDGKLVFYSLGNGVFNSDGWQLMDPGSLPYGYFLKWDLELENIQVYPFWSYNQDTFWQPHFISPNKLAQVDHDISMLDKELSKSGAQLDSSKQLYYDVSVINETSIHKSKQNVDIKAEKVIDEFPDKLMLSIIIPLYNREEMIINCLDSIANQSLSQELFEVIIIDDCSTDNGIDIVSQYSKIRNLRLISLPKNSGGASKPRNIGINEAIGQYTVLIDSDDTITEKALELALGLALESNLDMVVIPIMFGEKRKAYTPLFEEYPDGIHSTLLSENERVNRLLFSNPGIIGRLYKTSLLQGSGIRFSEKMRIYEDTLFGKFISSISDSFGMVSLSSAHYYPTPATNNENLSILKRTVNRCLLYLTEAIKMCDDIPDEILSQDKKIRIINHSFCRNNIFDVLNCPEGYKALGEHLDLLLPYLHHNDIRNKAKGLIRKVSNEVVRQKNISLAEKYFSSKTVPKVVATNFSRAWYWKEKVLVLDFKIKGYRIGIDINGDTEDSYNISLVLRGNSMDLDINWSNFGIKKGRHIDLFSSPKSKGLEEVLGKVTTTIDSLNMEII